MSNYCAFILTHGRPNNVKTEKTLRNCGFTGEIFYIVDDEDKTLTEYQKKYGKNVITFSKSEIASKFDEADNFNQRKTIFYARNACFDIAEKLGYKYFIQFDDDYSGFYYRFDSNKVFRQKKIKNIDKIFNLMFAFVNETQFTSIAMMQGGDYIGGGESLLGKKIYIKRKAMNSFFCSTDKRFSFLGRINEDVSTYSTAQRTGQIFGSINLVSLKQAITQSNQGGMTDVYKESGTYVKSFYSVMHCPSAVIVKDMTSKHGRIHHKVNYEHCAPAIIDEKWKKKNG